MTGNFDSARHALYVGWVLGVAKRHGLNVLPVVDDLGDYLPSLELRFATGVLITVVVPPPPDDWDLTDE